MECHQQKIMSTDIEIFHHDDVYLKIKCPDNVAAELAEHFSFFVPGYKHMPKFVHGVWDGKIRLFNIRKRTIYQGLYDHVVKYLKSFDYKFKSHVPQNDRKMSLADIQEFIKTIDLPEKYQVRDYQLKSLEHVINNNRALVLSPTSSGKSLLIYILIRYFDVKTLIIVPTTTLVDQMYSDFEDYGFDSKSNIHKIYSGQDKHTKKQITVSTWQSLFREPTDYFKDFQLVIGDEAHTFAATSLKTIMEGLTKCPVRIGTTGSLDGSKTNKMVLEGLFGPTYVATSTSELMIAGHVAKLTIKCLNLQWPVDTRKQAVRAKYDDENTFLVENPTRNRMITNLAKTTEGNVLILFRNRSQGNALYQLCADKIDNREIYYVDGKVKTAARTQIRTDVNKEKTSVLIASVGTFATGINIQNIDVIIFAAPTKSRIRNIQAIGRGLRKSERKTECVLYDLSDDLSHNKWVNHTLRHFMARIQIYNEEKFNYKIFKVPVQC